MVVRFGKKEVDLSVGFCNKRQIWRQDRFPQKARDPQRAMEDKSPRIEARTLASRTVCKEEASSAMKGAEWKDGYFSMCPFVDALAKLRSSPKSIALAYESLYCVFGP